MQNEGARKFPAPYKKFLNLLRFFIDSFFSGDSFAALVAYGAARLASGLAGTSAFATACYFSISGFCDGLDHIDISP